MYLTTAEVLAATAQHCPDRPAIFARNFDTLSHRALYECISRLAEDLNALGIGRGDRVALATPNGAELAVGFLGISSGATCVPFDPLSPRDDFQDLFHRLHIKALVYQPDHPTDAIDIARTLGLTLIEFVKMGNRFSFRGMLTASPAKSGFAQAEDISHITATSGTTGKPKIIAITHSLYARRTQEIIAGLETLPTDRVINMMPLFHNAALNHLMRTLAAGGSMICLPGFDPKIFFQVLEESQPTSFSAVATMCEAILAYLGDHPDHLHPPSLRFIRAGSMALSPALRQRMEQTFRVPIIQSYSSSETNIISTDRLPPFKPKPEAAGRIVETMHVRIIDEQGQDLSLCAIGEIVVAGPLVFEGYADDPALNASAFWGDYFRTGDSGYIDNEGYLFVVGRIKELINRGGQKVAPTEVENVLVQHPAVADVGVFPVPDPYYGETVAAAVILHPNMSIKPEDLRQFAVEHLVAYKAPEHIVLVDSLPYNALRKLQRGKLTEQFRDYFVSNHKIVEHVAPVTATEQQLRTLWSEVLGQPADQIGVQDRFRDRGGVSLTAVQLIFKVRDTFQLPVTIADFFYAATIAEQAQIIEQRRTTPTPAKTLIPIRAEGNRTPLYLAHALKGGLYFYTDLLPYTAGDRPLYGLQAVGIDDNREPLSSIDAIADHHAAQIKAFQPRGYYLLCGFSLGGRIALETARRLGADGTHVYVLMIDDTMAQNVYGIHNGMPHRFKQHNLKQLENVWYGLFKLPPQYRVRFLRERLTMFFNRLRGCASSEPREPLDVDGLPPTIQKVFHATHQAARTYVPRPYEGPLTYLRASGQRIYIPTFRVLQYIGGDHLDLIDIPGAHSTVMQPPYVERVGLELQKWLSRIESAESASSESERHK